MAPPAEKPQSLQDQPYATRVPARRKWAPQKLLNPKLCPGPKFFRKALALPMRGIDGNHKQRRGSPQIYQRIQNIRAQMTIGKCTRADHRAIMRGRQRQSLK